MQTIQNSYLIEVNFGSNAPANGQNIYFQDYPQLRNIYVTGVLAADVNTASLSPTGKTVVGALTGLAVTLLNTSNVEVIRQYPALDLDPFYISGYYRDFAPFPIQLTKSYITILNATGYSANESILLNLAYITAEEYNKKYNNPIRRK